MNVVVSKCLDHGLLKVSNRLDRLLRSLRTGKKFVTDADETMDRSKIVKIHVLISINASLRPWKKVCCSAEVQSSSPISSCNRYTASWRSSSLSHFVVRGKFGKMKNAEKAIMTVMMPSRMKTHLQARRPCVPSILLVIPAVIRPPKAPEISDPE